MVSAQHFINEAPGAVFSDPSGPRAGQEEARGPRGYIIISATVFWAPLVYHLQTETSENFLIMNDKTTFVTFSIDLIVCFFVSCLLRK